MDHSKCYTPVRCRLPSKDGELCTSEFWSDEAVWKMQHVEVRAFRRSKTYDEKLFELAIYRPRARGKPLHGVITTDINI